MRLEPERSVRHSGTRGCARAAPWRASPTSTKASGRKWCAWPDLLVAVTSLSCAEAALRRIVNDLRDLHREFALVGGLAPSARTEPRLTRGADLAVRLGRSRCRGTRSGSSGAGLDRHGHRTVRRGPAGDRPARASGRECARDGRRPALRIVGNRIRDRGRGRRGSMPYQACRPRGSATSLPRRCWREMTACAARPRGVAATWAQPSRRR
jgi:hypothetical protein